MITITPEYLQDNVVNGNKILFNTTTKQAIDVNQSNVHDIAIMLDTMSKGHGIGHLIFKTK